MKKTEYIISSAAIYDSDLEMYGVKVGLKKKDMPLQYTVWASTADQARAAAELLVSMIEFYHSKNK